ncbi:MAG: hypothetical protein ABH881_02705 [bacterium]
MERRRCFIKISSHILYEEDIIKLIRTISKDHFVVICVEGKTQIDQAFAEKGFPQYDFSSLNRETKSFEERQSARNILEINQMKMQKLLRAENIHANVIIPIKDCGTILCHPNGDQFVFDFYPDFDRLFVITTKDRVNKKRVFFENYPKVKVLGI